jgi:hypothetical protein
MLIPLVAALAVRCDITCPSVRSWPIITDHTEVASNSPWASAGALGEFGVSP